MEFLKVLLSKFINIIIIPEGEVSPVYSWESFSEDEDKSKDNGKYFTNESDGDLLVAESETAISQFHDQDLSLDHGLNDMTASEGLEGLPMITLTPASQTNLGCRILQRM